jgi:hypothetical protein
MHPRGVCKSSPFYFRGSEPLTEPEYLAEQLALAKSRYREAKQGLEKDRQEFEEVNRVISEKDGYTLALASALGEESNATEETASLRQKVADLTAEIGQTQTQIDEYKARMGSTFLMGLARERAYYHAEIENLKIQVAQGLNSIEVGKLKIGNLVRGDSFSTALELSAKRNALTQQLKQLRREMDCIFQSFTESKPKSGRKIDDDGTKVLNKLFNSKLALTLDVDHMRRRKFYKEVWGRESGLSVLDQIEEMDQVVTALGGERSDFSGIRGRFLMRHIESDTKENESEVKSKSRLEKGKERTRTRPASKVKRKT